MMSRFLVMTRLYCVDIASVNMKQVTIILGRCYMRRYWLPYNLLEERRTDDVNKSCDFALYSVESKAERRALILVGTFIDEKTEANRISMHCPNWILNSCMRFFP